MESKVSNQQIAAKKYIEENELEKIVAEMLNALVHEKAKQPLVYMIKYLAGLLTEEERKENNLVIPEPFPKGKPIVKFPNLDKTNSILKKYLTKTLWQQIKYNKTKFGGNIMNIIKLAENSPNNKIGVSLTDVDCINTFSALLIPIINQIHHLDNTKNINETIYNSHHVSASPVNFPYNDKILDRIQSVCIAFSRNLQDFPFAPIISGDKRSVVENLIHKAIDGLVNEKIMKEGKYLNIKDNEGEIKELLKDVMNYENYMSELKEADMVNGI